MTPVTLEEQLEASIQWAEKRKERTMTQKAKVEFETNIWRVLALKWPDGINGENSYGTFVRFQTLDEETLFTPEIAAAKIRALALQPGEKFKMRKAEIKNGGGKPHVEWQVARLTDNPQNGVLVIPKERAAASIEATHPEAAARIREQIQKETATPPGAAVSLATGATQPPSNIALPVNGNGTNGHHKLPESPYEHSGQAALLRETTNMLVDVLASCKAYSTRHNGLIAADDVRSIMLSAYINLSKGGRP